MSPRTRRALAWLVAVPLVLFLLLLIVSAIGAVRFRNAFEAEAASLQARALAVPSPAETPLEELPPPVRRYLEVTGAAGKPPIQLAILQQTGSLRTGVDKPWMPFEADQVYSIDPPGFVWLADATIAPLVHLLAQDSFVEGRGRMHITVAGLFDIADATG